MHPQLYAELFSVPVFLKSTAFVIRGFGARVAKDLEVKSSKDSLPKTKLF